MNWDPIIQDTVSTLLPIASALFAGLVAIGLKKVNTLIQANVESKRMQTALWQLSETVTSTVMDLEQEVRKGYADGTFTKDEQQALKAKARERIKTQAPMALQALASAGIKDLDAYVNGKIEQAVKDMKS